MMALSVVRRYFWGHRLPASVNGVPRILVGDKTKHGVIATGESIVDRAVF